MFNAKKKLPAAISPHANLAVLVVSSFSEDYCQLAEMLRENQCQVSGCRTATEAMAKLASACPALVVCERDLPDGNWKMLLTACESQPKPPLILVVSRHADESLWAEVLNLGGYDVLLKPFDASEVRRVFQLALRQWAGDLPKPPAPPELPPLRVQFA